MGDGETGVSEAMRRRRAVRTIREHAAFWRVTCEDTNRVSARIYAELLDAATQLLAEKEGHGC